MWSLVNVGVSSKFCGSILWNLLSGDLAARLPPALSRVVREAALAARWRSRLLLRRLTCLLRQGLRPLGFVLAAERGVSSDCYGTLPCIFCFFSACFDRALGPLPLCSLLNVGISSNCCCSVSCTFCFVFRLLRQGLRALGFVAAVERWRFVQLLELLGPWRIACC